MSAAGAGAGGELAQAGSVEPEPTATSLSTSPSAAAPAAETPVGRVRKPLLMAIVLTVLAVASTIAASLALQRGITSDNFPPFLPGEEFTTITKYSGPWLTAAAGFALVAALLLVAAVVDLIRRFRRPRRNDDARA